MSGEPDWDHLRSLLAVSRGGTFTAAAKALGVKHSTVSRHILELESQIRSKIVEREAGGVRTTSAGDRLVEAAEAMERQFQSARDDIAGRDLLVSGTVRIGAPDGFGSLFLAPRLPRLFNVTRREADIAIALAVPEQGRLTARKLCRYGLGLYASAGYLRRAPRIRTIDDLRSHPFINYIDDQLFTRELDYLDEICPGAQASFQSTNILAQAQAAATGNGLCILPYFIAKQYPGLMPVLPAQTRIERTWFMLVHEDQRSLSRIRVVSDFLFDQIQQSLALFCSPEAR